MSTCTACGGTGVYDALGSPPCDACDGKGIVEDVETTTVYVLRSADCLFAFATRGRALRELALYVKQSAQKWPESPERERLLRMCDSPLRHAELEDMYRRARREFDEGDYVLEVVELEVES
jgi:hypothetical protein